MNGIEARPLIADGSAHVWWGRLASASAHPGLVGLLNPVEQGRRERYRMEADRHRFTLGCSITRLVLAGLTGRPPETIELDRTCPDCEQPHGKVSVIGVPVEMSLSHSGDLVGVAFAGTPVGLDVEQVNRSMDVNALAPSVLTGTELAHLSGLPEVSRVAAFIGYWTRKEAVLKMAGTGLRTPLAQIQVSPPDGPAVLEGASGVDLSPGEVRLCDLAVDPGYRACLAVRTGAGVTVHQHDAADLLATWALSATRGSQSSHSG